MKMIRHMGWMLTVVCLLAGCQRKASMPVPVEFGDVRLSLSSIDAEIGTRVDEIPQEGYAFHNLLVILADEHGQVVDKVYKDYPYTPSAGDLQTAAGALPETDVILFQNIAVGTYHAYAYANIDHTDWQIAGETVAQVEKQLHTLKQDGETVTLDTGRTLRDFETGTAPGVPATDPMLLTGQVEVPVSMSVNQADLPLKRPVIRLNVYVNNHAPFDLEIQDIRFSPFNATKAYLLEHRLGSGKPPILPEGNEYVDLPPLSGTVTVPRHGEDDADEGNRTLVYSSLLYESTAPAYRIFMQLALLNSGLANSVRTLGSTTREVRLMSPSEVLAMEPGDSKTVLLVNPQNSGIGVVVGWDGTDFVFRKSPSIASGEDYFTWLQNIVLAGDMEPYFLRLERQSAGGPFALYSGDHNIFENLDYLKKDQSGHNATGASGMTALSVPAVNPTRTWPQISSDFYPYLLRFYCNTSQTENRDAYLWNSNQTALRTFNDAVNQSRQWTLYEVTSHPIGATINYVEKGTNKTKPVTYMARNHEYNISIDVYFVEFETQFDFVVDNSFWTDDKGHSSGHIFN